MIYQIVNVSTAEVVKGVLHPVFRYPIHKPLQIYLLSSTFYSTNGAIIDRSSIIPSQVQLRTHTLKLGIRNEWRYGVIFDEMTYMSNITCSFAFLVIKNRQYGESVPTMMDHSRTKRAALDYTSTKIDSSYIAAQIQAVAFIRGNRCATRISFKHYIVCVHSMNNVLRVLFASITTDPTMVARALLNRSCVHARASGQILEVWPCARVTGPTIQPMPYRTYAHHGYLYRTRSYKESIGDT